MAASVKINGVTYSAVPVVEIPKSDDSGTVSFYDTSAANVSPADIMAGKKAYGASGEVQGTATVPTVSQNSSTKVLSIS